ncbi:MAG TPA: YifB family Mg chelatase-like AAA ATPase [Smithellaceae bacterium]|mgnify:CR=1 FL=1|nr:YifB family Mg chelatase-like AAA ATPase [Smithellaceae bacterium]HRS89879.1 YifB family Mg chelatase-like AAA ATPase [Smithellaceae bacterium]HRV26077.1 YifB family Mg chelatase-like AAA ATPase [Smithellaceae bacterium]
MFVKISSMSIIGMEAYPVLVEVDISQGLPQFATVGLPDASVKESRDRIKAAIKNSGYRFPRAHVTVNLAPADVKKEGTAFDLPIAVGILAAEELIKESATQNCFFMGELSLDGSVKKISGVLSATFKAKESGFAAAFVPQENAAEAAMVEGINVYPVSNLPEVVEFLNGRINILPLSLSASGVFRQSRHYDIDFSEIKGQKQALRALEIAAAGGHNVLMIGPPGSGKSMLAKRLPTILPDLSFEEAIEVTKVFSVAGSLTKEEMMVATRPFRSPHHTISDAGLVGGGQTPRPGEISLAHLGVLFLDELPEFKRNALEALRQPLEEGEITITRSSVTASFPARFMLVAAMNPCPCGYFGDRVRACRCSPQQIRQYQGKISGPLMDRIDLHIEVPSVKYRALASKESGESSGTIKNRVIAAREIQKKRFHQDGLAGNARMTEKQIKEFCAIDDESHSLIEMAIEKLGLSARAINRILKISRTIADLDNKEKIAAPHVAEAIQYRSLDRSLI